MTTSEELKEQIAALTLALRNLEEKELDFSYVFNKIDSWIKERPNAKIAVIGPKVERTSPAWEQFKQELADRTLPNNGAELFVRNNSFDTAELKGRKFDYYAVAESETPPQERADLYGVILGRARGGVYIERM